MVFKKLKYIFIDEGEYLYDCITRKTYTLTSPHRCIGVIDKEFKLVLNGSPRLLL
jgi:hypothetical protein